MAQVIRHIENKLLKVLDFSPVVYLNGPRQAGKSTLVQKISKKDFPAEYVSFDSITQMSSLRPSTPGRIPRISDPI